MDYCLSWYCLAKNLALFVLKIKRINIYSNQTVKNDHSQSASVFQIPCMCWLLGRFSFAMLYSPSKNSVAKWILTESFIWTAKIAAVATPVTLFVRLLCLPLSPLHIGTLLNSGRAFNFGDRSDVPFYTRGLPHLSAAEKTPWQVSKSWVAGWSWATPVINTQYLGHVYGRWRSLTHHFREARVTIMANYGSEKCSRSSYDMSVLHS